MKILKYISAIMVVLLSVTGCNDDEFLTKYPNNSVAVDEYYQDAGQALNAVNAAYRSLNRRSLYWGEFFIGFGAQGDDVQSIELSHASYTFNSSEPLINSTWQLLYQGIGRANIVLDKVPNINSANISEELRNRILGEALYLRALYYWHLVTIYGEVPLITKYETKVENYNGHKKSIPEIWSQIEKDLLDARKTLPYSYDASNIGRATWGAATALLGKSYLFQKKYTESANTFKELLAKNDELKLYSLVSNLNQIFSINNENNSESLFEVQFGLNHGEIAWANEDNPSYGQSGMRNVYIAAGQHPGGGWENYFPSQELVNAFELNDPRKKAFVYSLGDSLAGQPFRLGKTTTGCNVKKGMLPETSPWSNNGYGENWILIRYADVLLMYAEALAMGGGTDNPSVYINMVRARAFGKNYDESVHGIQKLMADKGWDIMTAIKHERFIELCFENHRFPDLIRWGDASTALSSRGYIAKFKYWPIPPSEIGRSEGQLTQNPDWD